MEHQTTHTTSEPRLDDLFDSVSRLASGSHTPHQAQGAGHFTPGGRWVSNTSLPAEELVARLTGQPTRRSASASSYPRSTSSSLAVAIPAGLKSKVLIAFSRPPSPPEPINLELYNIEGFPLPLTTGSACGWLIRFSLLEWDEDRLDRLLLSLRRSMPEGAEARTSRMLLHDGDWVWRLQITLYLGPFLGWQERTFAAAAMSGRHQRARLRPAGLIAAI